MAAGGGNGFSCDFHLPGLGLTFQGAVHGCQQITVSRQEVKRRGVRSSGCGVRRAAFMFQLCFLPPGPET